MVRRSPSSASLAERFFPVRLRLAVPPRGFGVELNAMNDWLERHAGRRNYFVGGNGGAGTGDAACFYFLDLATADAFAQAFGATLSLAVGSERERPY